VLLFDPNTVKGRGWDRRGDKKQVGDDVKNIWELL